MTVSYSTTYSIPDPSDRNVYRKGLNDCRCEEFGRSVKGSALRALKLLPRDCKKIQLVVEPDVKIVILLKYWIDRELTLSDDLKFIQKCTFILSIKIVYIEFEFDRKIRECEDEVIQGISVKWISK